jgi:hypothetical protein
MRAREELPGRRRLAGEHGRRVPCTTVREIKRVMQIARPQWMMKDALLGTVNFRLPMLEYDTEAVLGAGIGMWTDR